LKGRKEEERGGDEREGEGKEVLSFPDFEKEKLRDLYGNKHCWLN